MKRLGFVILAGSVLAAQPTLAAEPIRLTPATKWVLSYDEEACRLMRGFGSGKDAISITFAKYAPGTLMEVMIGGRSLEPQKKALKYRFLPSGELEEPSPAYFGRNADNGTVALFSASLAGMDNLFTSDSETAGARRQLEASRALEIESIEFVQGFDRPFIVETGSLGDAMKAIDVCLDDLVASWGFDPAVQAALRSTPEPRGDPGTWIRTSDYPRQMLAGDRSGSVRFRLDVDERGQVTKCVVQGSYSDPAFQKTTCEALTRRAAFKPAISSAGEPVASFWATAVNFVI